MDEQVRRDAARVIPVAAPPEEAVQIERPLRRGSEELIPVHRLRAGIRWNRVQPRAAGAVAVVGGAHLHDLPDLARLHQLPRLDHVRAAHALAPDLHDAVAVLHGVENAEAVLDRVAHRLLEIDVLLRRQRLDGHRLVPVIRRDDEDGIDAGHRQDLVVVLDDRRAATCARLRPFGPALVGVAHGDHLDARHLHQVLQVLVRAGAAANDANGQSIARGDGLRLARARQRCRGTRHHGGLHEVASIHRWSPDVLLVLLALLALLALARPC